jgi:hypothetical protein
VGVVEQAVGAKQGENAADAGDQDQVVLLEFGLLGEAVLQLVGVQKRLQFAKRVGVALLALHFVDFFKQLAVLKVVDDKVQQVDVDQPQALSLLRSVAEQKANMLADAQLVLRGIVEDVEGNFIAQPLPGQEIVRHHCKRRPKSAAGKRP